MKMLLRVLLAFHEHFSFFAETYSLNGTESEKALVLVLVLCKLDMTSLYK